MTADRHRRWPIRIAAGVAIVFGAMTVVSGGSVLFGGQTVQSAAGAVVPFVLWFNFLSGFAYVLAGVGLMWRSGWAVWMAGALAGSIAALFALFGLHVLQGGAFEMRTVGAMILRLAVWVVIALIALRTIPAR